jgi:hypothetical protein
MIMWFFQEFVIATLHLGAFVFSHNKSPQQVFWWIFIFTSTNYNLYHLYCPSLGDVKLLKVMPEYSLCFPDKARSGCQVSSPHFTYLHKNNISYTKIMGHKQISLKMEAIHTQSVITCSYQQRMPEQKQ